MLEKPELRKKIRRALRECSRNELLEASAMIRAAVSDLPQWQAASIVGLFAAHPLEPLVDPLFQEAMAAGKRVVFPRVDPEGLTLVEVTSEADLREAPPWNLREPAGAHLTTVVPNEVGLLLVPGLAFDSEGYRLGRGGGYYDRLLGELPRAVCCGVCFYLQLVQEVPREPHDRPVGLMVTELGARPCAPAL